MILKIQMLSIKFKCNLKFYEVVIEPKVEKESKIVIIENQK